MGIFDKNTPLQTEYGSEFIDMLKQHLQRVVNSEPKYGPFVAKYLHDQQITAIAGLAAKTMKLMAADGVAHSTALNAPPIHYDIWTLPVELKEARDWFVRKHGGYTSFLNNALQKVSNESLFDSCIAFCQFMYGLKGTDSWIHMAIVPSNPNGPIDIMIPIDFITTEEKKRFQWHTDDGENDKANIDINNPKCFSCGKALRGGDSIFEGARVTVIGSKSVQELQDEYTLFRGTICFKCKTVVCMECIRGALQRCPQCQGETKPAYRKHLLELSKLL